jgi:hypothetical protein
VENAGKKESFADGSRGASPFLDKFSGSGRGAGPAKFNGLDDEDDFYDDDDDDDDDDDFDDDDMAADGDGEAGETEDAEEAVGKDEIRKRAEAVRAKTPEELFAELNALGLPVTKEILAADAVHNDSTITMSLEWGRRYRQMETAREEETAWEAARALWEKLDPAGTPCLEAAFDEITEGYGLWECNGDDDGALERWFAAWDMLKASLGRISRTYDEIDRQVATPEGGLDEWAEDICCLLADLAEERGGDEYEVRRKKFIAEFVAAFRDFPVEVAVSLKCEPAERLFEDGKPAEADAVLEAVAAEYPGCHMVYERWAAAYSGRLFDRDNTLPPDLEKARGIAERGIAVENIDDRLELLNTVREINSHLLKTGRLEGAELEAARAAAEFEEKYKRASLEEKLNMLDELCVGNALRSFERFVEPMHFYEFMAWDLADAGMIDRALGLAALIELRQPELFKYHFATFEHLRAMVKLSGGDAESAGRSIERLMNDEPPCYEYIPLIAKAAAVCGMENAVAEKCLAAARNYFMYENHRGSNDASGSDLKFLAAAIIFGEAFSKVEAGESIDEKDLELKLLMAGWPGSSTAAAKCFVEEIASGRKPSRLDKNSLGKTDFQKFSDTLFRMSLQYFKHMRVEKGRGFVFSSIVWGFVVDFLMGRAAKEHRQPDLERYFRFNKYELKDFALDRCRPFGDEKDKLPDTAAGLKLMKTVYEFLRDAGTLDDETCRNACAAADWTLAKLMARYQKRAWQLGFVERL